MTAPVEVPAAPACVEAFEVRQGTLCVGGVPVDRLAVIAGGTPFFAYDRALLTARVRRLREALPSRVRLSYAVKANPMPAVVQHLAGLVDSFDVASALEMRIALDTPIGADHVSFAGPGKTDAELTAAVAAGVTIELESAGEARRALGIGSALGVRPRVAVRVNPDFEVKGSGMRMGGGPQQFGVDSEEVPDLVRRIVAGGADFLGFHVFAGSQNLRADVIAEAQRRTARLVLRLAEGLDAPPRYVNLGGGFGIPYFPKDAPLDVEAVGRNLHEVVEDLLAPQFPDARLVVELGRYVVGECGVYVTRVVDRKVSRGRTYLVVDGGMHHHLAASGNFGQIVRRNYPLAVATRMGPADSEQVNVVGCLCTPLDVLGDKVALPVADVGDLVAVFQSGAYGMTASPTAFLGHPAPAELLV